MKRDLVEILACPMCKGDLEVKMAEENEKEIVNGSLYCPECKIIYPIVDTIPNLLPPDRKE